MKNLFKNTTFKIFIFAITPTVILLFYFNEQQKTLIIALCIELILLAGKGVLDSFLNSQEHLHALNIKKIEYGLDKNIVYDILSEYRDFAKEYINRLIEVKSEALVIGPVLSNFIYTADELRKIRMTYYSVIPSDINTKLELFERGLRRLGFSKVIIDVTSDGTFETGERPVEKYTELLEEFSKFVNPEKDSVERFEIVEDLINEIKNLLSIDDLFLNRIKFLNE
jgi:hypothetical protein